MLQKEPHHFLSPIVYFGDSLQNEEDEEIYEFNFFDPQVQFRKNIGLFLNWTDTCDENFFDLCQRD